jgi:hypothetical protein
MKSLINHCGGNANAIRDYLNLLLCNRMGREYCKARTVLKCRMMNHDQPKMMLDLPPGGLLTLTDVFPAATCCGCCCTALGLLLAITWFGLKATYC